MKVTAVTEPPAYHDRAASVARAAAIVGRAAAEGSSLVVFSEAWIPGYPDFVWTISPSNDVDHEASRAYAHLWDNAVDLGTDVLAPLLQAVREAGLVVVLGIQEKAGGTLYNTALVIDADGTILNVHRKLMPTNAERMAWGFGDGSGLRVVDTAVGRVAVLLCWENYMPLARAALYGQAPEILVRPDGGPLRHLARHDAPHCEGERLRRDRRMSGDAPFRSSGGTSRTRVDRTEWRMGTAGQHLDSGAGREGPGAAE